jgi:AraC-like DNA-binding protein
MNFTMRANECIFAFHHSPAATDKNRLAVGTAAHVIYRPPTACNRPSGWHVDVILYTIRGAARGVIAGVPSRATAGSLWIHPKEHPYSFDIDPATGYWEGYWVEIGGLWFHQILSMFRLKDTVHVENCIPAGPVFDELFNCLRLGETSAVREAAGLIWRILAIAEGVHYQLRTQTSPSVQAVERAKNFARQNVSARLCVDDMANAACLSSYHFSHIFRSETGSTPMNYVRALRIGRARELLYKGNMSIKQVAQASGYASVQHFTAAFKRATGYTPGEFRKSLTPTV